METKERSIITRHVFIDIINGNNNDFLNLFPLLPVRFFKSSSSSSGVIFLMFFLFFLLLRCDFFNLLPPLVRHHRYPSSSSSSLHGRVCHRRRATWARSRCASASPVARWTTECSPPACALCNEKSSLITRSSRARVVATDRSLSIHKRQRLPKLISRRERRISTAERQALIADERHLSGLNELNFR